MENPIDDEQQEGKILYMRKREKEKPNEENARNNPSVITRE